ncbi:hypothetical protein ACJZ2D_016837 [Fusarium nematophilum]
MELRSLLEREFLVKSRSFKGRFLVKTPDGSINRCLLAFTSLIFLLPDEFQQEALDGWLSLARKQTKTPILEYAISQCERGIEGLRGLPDAAIDKGLVSISGAEQTFCIARHNIDAYRRDLKEKLGFFILALKSKIPPPPPPLVYKPLCPEDFETPVLEVWKDSWDWARPDLDKHMKAYSQKFGKERERQDATKEHGFLCSAIALAHALECFEEASLIDRRGDGEPRDLVLHDVESYIRMICHNSGHSRENISNMIEKWEKGEYQHVHFVQSVVYITETLMERYCAGE